MLHTFLNFTNSNLLNYHLLPPVLFLPALLFNHKYHREIYALKECWLISCKLRFHCKY